MIDPKESQDIGLFRVNLENFAIDNMDIFKASLEDICRYSAECQYALNMGNRAKAFELDSLFHVALIRTANNTAFTDTYERLDAKIQLLRVRQNESNEKLLEYIVQHTKLIELIKNGRKEEAKELMNIHILHDVNMSIRPGDSV